jgi:hypothetical protein
VVSEFVARNDPSPDPRSSSPHRMGRYLCCRPPRSLAAAEPIDRRSQPSAFVDACHQWAIAALALLILAAMLVSPRWF